MVTYDDSDKGAEVRITGGKYKDSAQHAWLWAGKNQPKQMVHVIIKLDTGEEIGRRVRKENVGEPFGPPKSRMEAALQQHGDINRAFDDLCKLLVQCDLENADTPPLNALFVEKMKAAHAKQLAQGSKATWREVDFKTDNGKDEMLS